MNDEPSLASSDENIIELIYFIPMGDAPDASTGDGTENENFQDRANGGLAAAPFIAAGACGLVLVAFYAGRKLLKDKEEDTESEEDSENENYLGNNSLDVNDSGNMLVNGSILNSSGSVTVSSSFAT